MPSRASLHALGRALRHRNYRLFFAGQTISLVGTWLTRVATSWLVYRLTNSALLLGVIGFVGQIPTFLVAPFAGVWIDRLDRHRVLVVTQVLAMLQSALLAAFALQRHDHGLARRRAQRVPGAHQRLRHARAAGVRDRHGGEPRRPPERHRAQLLHGQLGEAPRPVHRRLLIAAWGEAGAS
jgi:hypothetical protein